MVCFNLDFNNYFFTLRLHECFVRADWRVTEKGASSRKKYVEDGIGEKSCGCIMYRYTMIQAVLCLIN